MDRRSFLGSLVALGAAACVGHLPSVVPASHHCAYVDPTDKFELIKALLANGIRTHDDLIEQAIFGGTNLGELTYD